MRGHFPASARPQPRPSNGNNMDPCHGFAMAKKSATRSKLKRLRALTALPRPHFPTVGLRSNHGCISGFLQQHMVSTCTPSIKNTRITAGLNYTRIRRAPPSGCRGLPGIMFRFMFHPRKVGSHDSMWN